MFDTPILFIVFNRPDQTRRVFEAIRNIKPTHLFIAADGPRIEVESDKRNCDLVKEIVSVVDWDCKLQTLYREDNSGCGLAVSSSINWFFENVEKGIILEDDCLPNNSFFSYCDQMLRYYKDNLEIMHISGNCYGENSKNGSYHFTRLPFIWGWATWRRAWNQYDFNLKYISPEEKNVIISQAFDNNDIIEYWEKTLKNFHLSPVSYTWDYQWFLTIWKIKGFVIQPSLNLIENIGFGNDATHTTATEHYLGKIKANLHTIKSFSRKVKINPEFQDQNFYFYFNNMKFKSKWRFLRKLNTNVLETIKFKVGKLVFQFLDYYSKKVYLSNPFEIFKSFSGNSVISKKAKLYPVYKILDSEIGDFTYVSRNSVINNTTIGKFCSIGPNLISGWGFHPTKGISTHPMFYSTAKQNNFTLSSINKIDEFKTISIGNDVFIGMNVTILDGVTIGDGAIIGAGAVVSKDIPPYAIAVGNPIRVIDYRFTEEIVKRLLEICWWDSTGEKLALVEKYFFDIEQLIQLFENDKLKDL